ncbi:hypothetical protein GUF72_16610 [Xanthomonas citri pv. citri]|nr:MULTISPECIES: hypothetical protein [Xanthomonas]AGI08244.1 Hypothetical Protein XCAW_02461 [Xanthomonas citri subsp. citri Aw12879]AJD68808.1 hypothetical protein J151_02382 [Xanthomonas citri subsp. citri A306]AJY82334.1 hypothetical protein J159_02371 [Xanthomonas citri pv. citri]AJY86758.1 hypothetical protein J158_02373 [Xanthomonas citri subsp. citri UI6]AJY91189.1 hypothetical protein J169_02380 [Xanthomonas citri pv. citri]
MANNHYEATGVLVLDRVTPVIRALFGGFQLDADYPGNGDAYIALVASNPPSWDDLREELVELAKPLGYTSSAQAIPAVGDVLQVLARHFGAEGNMALMSLIGREQFDDAADLHALFLLATCFDDGHHLREIRFEGCWRCDKPRLFEFGGEGQYLSREFDAHSASGHALQLGHLVREALSSGDFDQGATVIAREASRLLAGIHNAAHRRQLQRRVVWHLIEGLCADGEQ